MTRAKKYLFSVTALSVPHKRLRKAPSGLVVPSSTRTGRNVPPKRPRAIASVHYYTKAKKRLLTICPKCERALAYASVHFAMRDACVVVLAMADCPKPNILVEGRYNASASCLECLSVSHRAGT